MSPNRFEHLLSLVAPLISKETTRFRKPISADQRLIVTLRYLASGESQQSLSLVYRIEKATMSKILAETSDAIFTVLKDPFLKTPNSKEKWLTIAKCFEETWNFPHCIGAIDGKHIRIEYLKMSGSYYYN